MSIGEPSNAVHHVSSSESIAWTRVNAAEALPGLLTPLGWTFWDERVELALRGAFADMGVLREAEITVPPHVDERMTAVFYGRFTGNLDLLRMCADRTPGTSGSAVEAQLFGAVRPDVVDRPTRSRYPAIAVKLPRAMSTISRSVAKARVSTDQWWRVSTTRPVTTEDSARTLLGEAGARFQTVFRTHLLSTFLCQAVFEQLTILATTAGLPGIELRVSAGLGGMEEGRLVDDLWAVSRGTREISQFLADHGYHGFSEGEISRPSWRERPGALDALLASYRERGEASDPATTERSRSELREQAVRELLLALPRSRRIQAHVLLRLTARHLRLREVGKVCFLQTIDVARFASRALGETLCRTGAIGDPSDVFFLTFDELTSTMPTDAKAVIADRRTVHDRYSRLDLPSSWIGLAQPTVVGDGPQQRPEVSGVPVYPGLVEGRVNVVRDPGETDDFEAGDVLVCEFTDPSWTLLMDMAAALVIDIGGAMSHGAIIARELGIPTIIGTGDGSRNLSTGDRVRVDAEKGVVTVLARAEKAGA